jgi:AcrR family transcriptional regulator
MSSELGPLMAQAKLPDQPGSLKQERSRLSTSRLIQAAAELIATQGYDKTTFVEIGRRAGYSHGLVTLRFGSKEGLLLALIDKVTVEWSAREIEPVAQTQVGAKAIRVAIDGIRASVKRNPTNVRALYTLMFEAVRPIPALQERIRTMNEQQRDYYEAAILRGIEAGTVSRETNAGAAARLIVSALRGAAFQWLLEPEFDFDATLAALADHLELILTP